MGNHSAGAAIVALAETMADRRRAGETAISILDAAASKAKASSGFSPDIELDDAPYDDTPFRALLVEAYGDGDDFSDDEDGERFYVTCLSPFFEAHGFC